MPVAFDFCDESISAVASAGAGAATLGNSAKTGHRTLQSVLSNGNTVIVTFYLETPNDDANDWEVALCTYTAAGTSLSRDTVLASSNSGSLITLTTTHRARISFNAHLGSKIHCEHPTTGTVRIGLNAGSDSISGIDNTIVGSGAGSGMTSGQETTILGKDAGTVAGSTCTYMGKDAGKGATGAGNVAVGKDAQGGAGNSTGSNNVIIGEFAGDAMTSAADSVYVGENAGGANTSGTRNTLLGSQAGSGITTGSYNINIGHRGTFVNTANYQIGIGYRTDVLTANTCSFGSSFSGAHLTDVFFNGEASTTPDDCALNGAGGSGTDIAGANLIVAGGRGTGSGAGGQIQFKVANAGTTGTSQNALATAGYIAQTGGMVWGSPTGGDKGAGTINATAVYDDNTLLTDYVFEAYYDGKTVDDQHRHYQMRSLSDEIEFTKKYKHLSTMVGRKQWEKNGKSSTGQLISQLWETVETQFLYISQLENRISNLELN